MDEREGPARAGSTDSDGPAPAPATEDPRRFDPATCCAHCALRTERHPADHAFESEYEYRRRLGRDNAELRAQLQRAAREELRAARIASTMAEPE